MSRGIGVMFHPIEGYFICDGHSLEFKLQLVSGSNLSFVTT